MNLTNHFLISMPTLEDAFFAESVVYICRHDKEGAMGIIVNKPSPLLVDIVFDTAGIRVPPCVAGQWIMMGGPINLNRGYVLHKPAGKWESSIKVTEEIALTASRDILEHFGHDTNDRALLTIGQSGWSSGQLEKELAENSWLTMPADIDILFEIPYEKRYETALGKLGINRTNLMKDAGHA